MAKLAPIVASDASLLFSCSALEEGEGVGEPEFGGVGVVLFSFSVFDSMEELSGLLELVSGVGVVFESLAGRISLWPAVSKNELMEFSTVGSIIRRNTRPAIIITEKIRTIKTCFLSSGDSIKISKLIICKTYDPEKLKPKYR
ncbi:MAG: hypothetical protein R2747_04145 [Pyrinomonadaceae bacterium]